MSERIQITQRRLKELLHYNAKSGVFTWKENRKTGGANAGSVAGCIGTRGYRIIRIGDHNWRAQRLAWLYVHGRLLPSITQRDGNHDNNRIDNLTPSSRSEAMAHAKRGDHNTSGMKGVSIDKARGMFRASITVNRKFKHLGYFYTARSAQDAYVAAAEKHFGAFARAA